MNDDEEDTRSWADKLADKYVKDIYEEKYYTDWKNDMNRYDNVEDEFNKLFNAYGNSKEDWAKYQQNPKSQGYPATNPYHTTRDELERYVNKYKELLHKAPENVKASDWEKTPAVDDRWNELKEMLKDFDGTPMEKLAAIEKFVETH